MSSIAPGSPEFLFDTSFGPAMSYKSALHVDDRGSLLKMFEDSFAFSPRQILVQRNSSLGVERGMHHQSHSAHQESKIIQLLHGDIEWLVYDPGTLTISRIRLSISRSLVTPAGVYHGSLSKSPTSEVLIVADRPYTAIGTEIVPRALLDIDSERYFEL